MKLEINNMFATPESMEDLFNHPILQKDIYALTAAMMALNLVASKQKEEELNKWELIN